MGFSPETYAIIAGKGGKANGFATLDENGKVPTSQIPSAEAPITSDTETTLTGVLTGDGSKVGSKAIDTSSLTDDNDHIPSSGVVKSALPKIVTFTKTTDGDGYADFLSVTRSHCTILSVATDYSSGSVLFGDVGIYRSADYWTIWFHFKDGTSLANTLLNITLCIVEY